MGKDYQKNTSDDIEPQIGDLCKGVAGDNYAFCDNGGDKSGIATHFFQIKCDKKYTENGTVKKRTQDIDGLDKRTESIGE